MTSWLSPMGEWVWQTSLQVCLLVCIVRILQWTLRNRLSPRWLYALWLLVLVRLIMPIGLESSFSLYNFFQPTDEVAITSTAYEWVVIPMGESVYGPMDWTPPEDKPVSWVPILWLVGMGILMVHLFRQWLRLYRAIGNGHSVTDTRLLALFDTCRTSLHVKRKLLLVESDSVPTPGLFGLWNPRLVLPQGLIGKLSDAEWRHIFLHELAHYRRWDLPVNWLMTLLQVVHWFNPFVWYAFMRMREDRELACDALAMSMADENEAKAYGNTLLKLMKNHTGLRPMPGMVGILENHNHIKRRIISIARYTASSYKWSLLAVVVLCVAGSITLTQAKQIEGGEEVAEPGGDGNLMESETHSLEPVGEVEEDEPSKSSIRSVEPSEPEAGGDPLPKEVAKTIREILTLPTNVHIKSLHLVEVLDFVSDFYEINIILDQRVVAPIPGSEFAKSRSSESFVTDGMIEEVRTDGVPLGEFLSDVLNRLGLAYSIQTGVIWISTPENIERETFENLDTRFYDIPDDVLSKLGLSLTIEVWKEISEEDRMEAQAQSGVWTMLIPQIIDPDTKLELSFSFYNFKSRQLIVHNTPTNHRAFEETLQKLASGEMDIAMAGGTTQKRVGEHVSRSNRTEDEAAAVKEVQTTLENNVSFVYEDMHVEEIMEYIENEFGLESRIDPGIVAPESEPENSSVSKYHTDGMISYINLKNVTLRQALKALLVPLNLGYSVEPGYIRISTNVPNKLEVPKTSPISNLVNSTNPDPLQRVFRITPQLDGDNVRLWFVIENDFEGKGRVSSEEKNASMEIWTSIIMKFDDCMVLSIDPNDIASGPELIKTIYGGGGVVGQEYEGDLPDAKEVLDYISEHPNLGDTDRKMIVYLVPEKTEEGEIKVYMAFKWFDDPDQNIRFKISCTTEQEKPISFAIEFPPEYRQ